MKKDSFYFSHDYNAANDVKCLFLRQQLGMEGYGIFWYLVESLATAGGVLPLKIIPVLAMQMQVTETKVSAVINSFDLFTIEENHFFSSRLNQHLSLRKSLSDKGKAGAFLRWGNKEDSPPNDDPNSPPISVPNKGGNAKERKGNKRKGNTNTAALPQVSTGDFYSNELEKAKGEQYFMQYKALVNFILGDDSGVPLENVLALPKQIGYKKYLTLRNTYNAYQKRTIKETLESMEARKSLTKDYSDAFSVANVWLKNDFSKEKVA
jgi:hypothetical protein